MRIAFIIFVLTSANIAHEAVAADESKQPGLDRPVAELLIRRCLSCHGSDDPQGQLDLTNRATMIKGGESGAAIVPGKPDASYLIERITDGSMPPRKSGTRLSKLEVATLRAWVKDGANWPKGRTLSPFEFSTGKRAGFDWWSLQPIRRPPVPSVHNQNWLRNPIDAFVLSQLEKRGLSPQTPADRRTLIRRLKFDLLGLPPTLSEIHRFTTNNRPASWSRLIERTLASPRYGERWGRHWLDVVRYGESDGFEHDKLRPHAWRYRDYVIQSLNADKPYDEFAREQLAGDAIQPVTRDGLAATGFLVAGPWDEVQNVAVSKTERRRAREEEMSEIVAAVSQSFLGMTVHCARCHDHKFDPISQAVYYRLKAVFAGVSHADGNKPGNHPILTADERRQQARQLKPLRDRVAALDARIAKLQSHFPSDAIADGSGKNALTDGKFGRAANGKVTTFSARSQTGFQNPPFTVELWARADSANKFNVFVANQLKSSPNHWELYTFAGKGDFSAYLPGFSPATIRSGKVITDGKWHYLAMQFDGKLVRLFVDGKLIKKSDVKRIKPTGPAGQIYFAGYPPHKIGCDGAVDEMRISSGLRRISAVPQDRFGIDNTTIGLWRFDELNGRRIRNLATKQVDGKLAPQQLTAKLKQLTAERDRLESRIASVQTPIAYIGHRSSPPSTQLLIRGNPNAPGRTIRPAALSAIKHHPGNLSLTKNATDFSRRAKFANWVIDRRNPLTARVIANRIWQYHFGQGLVKTPSDLGFHGGTPSHPMLLDWLASELMQSGWSVKHLHRLILNSNTYRQSSGFNAKAAAVDADNRLLWRHTPRRLEGESIRDAMLFVSGALNPRMGGPSFRPFTVTVFNTHFYHVFDSDEPRYNRRSIYRMQISTGRGPFLSALDCPTPSLPAPQRRITTTPLQALALMNSSFAIRQANRFAQRVKQIAGKNTAKQIQRCFEEAYGRPPTTSEQIDATAFVENSSLSDFCWVLLNSSEFLYVR